MRALARQVWWLLPALICWGLSPAPSAGQEDVPEVVRRLLEEGGRHLRQDRVDEAIKVFNEALRLDKDTVQVYLDLGAAQVRKGDLSASKETFESGLRLEPNHRGLLYNAAVVNLRLDEPDQTLAHVSAAIAEHGEEVDLLMVRAGALARLERHGEALSALQRAEKIEPRSARIQFSLGNRLHSLNRLEEAAEAFKKAAKLDSKLNRALYNLGAVLIELGRFPEARTAYEKALKPFDKALKSGQTIDPIHAVAYANLGAAYSQSQDWQKALEAYAVAVRVDPSLADAHLNLGFAHYQLKDWQKAAGSYEKAVSIDPDLSPAYVQLGEIHHQAGQCSLAVDWFRRGLPRLQANERLRAMEGMARCYTELGKVEEAEQVFRQALAEAPADPRMLQDFGRVLRRRGRLDEAREALAESLRLRPDDRPTLLEALAVEEARGDVAAQFDLLRTLLDRHGDRPELWPARKSYALMLLAQGSWDSAIGHLQALAESTTLPAEEKNQAQTLASLALWITGKASREDIPAHGDPGLSALQEAEQGSFESAMEQLSKVGPSPTLDLLKGLLLWSRGEDSRARSTLERAEQGGVREIGLQIALGSLEAQDGSSASLEKSILRLQPAVRTCEESAAHRPIAEISGGQARVRRSVSRELCGFARRTLSWALLRRSVALLSRSPQPALRQARSAMEDPNLTEEQMAIAAFVEGSALHSRGANDGAVQALSRALSLDPGASWSAAAANNLGMAYSRLGQVAKAKQSLQAARSGSVDAILNLGILVHTQEKNPQGALKLYQEYVRAGGARRSEVQAWIDRLRELYP